MFPFLFPRRYSDGSIYGGTSGRHSGKSPSPSWSSQEIRGTVGNGGALPWHCVPDRVYPVSGYGPPKNINQYQAYQNRSNNNPDATAACKPPVPAVAPPQVQDSNRNGAAADDYAKHGVGATGGQLSIKPSKSFESGVLGQHANTPNGIIPWPGDRKSRVHPQWDQHCNNAAASLYSGYDGPSAAYNGFSSPCNGPSSPYGGSSSPYDKCPSPHNGLPSHGSSSANGGDTLFLGNRSSVVRSSSRGPTYFSPQHNHVGTRLKTDRHRVRIKPENFALFEMIVL